MRATRFGLFCLWTLTITLVACDPGASDPDASASMDAGRRDDARALGPDGASTDATIPDGGRTDPASSVSAALTASRTECVSPCTVVFSAEGTTAEGLTTSEAWRGLGYHFDFDGSRAGETHPYSGEPADREIGGPLAAHTFECAEGQCRFEVGVRAQRPEGDFSDAFVTVTVDAATHRYAPADTVCVSPAGEFAGCPAGASQARALPAIGAYSGRRILLRRGETFSAICLDYGERRVLIEPFGDPGAPRPEVADLSLGVDGSCGCRNMSTARARELNATGWISDVTATGLRVANVSYGMAYEHLGVHDVDMDYEDQPAGGRFDVTSNTSRCERSDTLDCAEVPFPVGAYVSSVDVVGSRASPPGVNFAAYDCGLPAWVGIIDASARLASQHNLRFQGAYRVFIGHGRFLGDHFTNGKQKLTLRGCGVTDLELVGARRGDLPPSDLTLGTGPRSRYLLVAHNTIGSATSGDTTGGDDGPKSGMKP